LSGLGYKTFLARKVAGCICLPLIGVRKEQQLQQGTEIWDIFIFLAICYNMH